MIKLRHVTIRNFRCLKQVSVPIDDTTVLVGENNTGKTAFLEAIRIVLTRSVRSARSTERLFGDFDYHLPTSDDTPETSPGIEIELWFKEATIDEWTDPIKQSLADVLVLNPQTELSAIGVRVTSKFNPTNQTFEDQIGFLNADGKFLEGKRASGTYLTNLREYVRVLFLSALRDADEQFSPRSQYWGRILRDLKISEKDRRQLQRVMKAVNKRLLSADPRLGSVEIALANAQQLLDASSNVNTAIQALPVQAWDLMSKAQVVINNRGSDVQIPLAQHGQGSQSLSVLYLLQAYIDVMLKPLFQPETSALLMLEEPEAHLHPHAVRALAGKIGQMESQKLISTHSPYFVQEVSLDNLRVFRRDGANSEVRYLQNHFDVVLATNSELKSFCDKDRSDKFVCTERQNGTATFLVKGQLQEGEYRKLCQFYAGNNDAITKLKNLCKDSETYISPEEREKLDRFVKQTRGEILFARGWLLCEGHTEIALLPYFAELLSKSLHKNGISLIGFKDNGSPESFVALARTLNIPCILFCDSDEAGKKYAKLARNQGLSADYLFQLPDQEDIETYMLKNGFKSEYCELVNRPITDSEESIVKEIQKDKVANTMRLVEKLRSLNSSQERVPDIIRRAIEKIISEVK